MKTITFQLGPTVPAVRARWRAIGQGTVPELCTLLNIVRAPSPCRARSDAWLARARSRQCSPPRRGLWHFALRFYLNLAQIVLAFMVIVYHGDEPCDTPIKTFVMVQGALSLVHVIFIGLVEASVVGGEHERYLDACVSASPPIGAGCALPR